VGIFSLFRKKDNKAPAQKSPGASSRNDIPAPRRPSRVTADKIDAIESEMSSEFVQPLPFSGNTLPLSPDQLFGNTNPVSGTLAQSGTTTRAASLEQATLPHMGSTTAILMNGETKPGPIALSEAAPVVEEAAILFANGQTDMIEPILRHAIEDDMLGSMPLAVWGMLFDLYQITGERDKFENLAIDYASRFERSPPAWIDREHFTEPATLPTRKGIAPGVAFTEKLDSGIVKQIERLRNLSDMSETLRLDFTRVKEVDPVGCGLLFNTLMRLQKSGHRLALLGAEDLAEKIRSILSVGRRDETEAPWLLLLEILRLLNREAEFEETSIDYCITFEVSPPAFTPPLDAVVAGMDEPVELLLEEEAITRFPMPTVVSNKNDTLLPQIIAFADVHQPAILDCTELVRMDFSAASQLFGGLMPVIASGKVIELYNANHFVAALCHVMGFHEMIRILPRKT